MKGADALAIHGGLSVRKSPLPNVEDASGRTFGQEEIDLLREVILSGRLNRNCPHPDGTSFTEQLENRFARMMGVPVCVASTSGTAALHIALGAAGLEPGDEVIVSPLSDVGSIIGVLYQNAIPIFADIDPRTFTLDPADVARKISSRTKVIMPVHLFGNACDLEPIMELADAHGLIVIEDCAQAYLTLYRGKLVGTYGDYGAFSMQQSKHITSGDGGLTISKHRSTGEILHLFADKGWPRPNFATVQFLAPNYRITELQSAVALAQLNHLESNVAARRANAELLFDLLARQSALLLPYTASNVCHSYWKLPLLLNRAVIGISVSEFSRALAAEGIPSWPGYITTPLYLFPFMRKKQFYGSSGCPFTCHGRSDIRYEPGLCPIAEQVLHDIIVLPWSERYTENDVQDIAQALNKVASHYCI